MPIFVFIFAKDFSVSKHFIWFFSAPYNIFFIDGANNSTAGPTNVSKGTLIAPGYILSVPVGTVKVRVQSINPGCSNYHLDLTVPNNASNQVACVMAGNPSYPNYVNRRMMDRLYDNSPYRNPPNTYYTEFTLNSCVVNGVQYATGQTLKVQSIAPLLSGFQIIMFGLCYDGVTICPTNVTDWMNSLNIPGIHFWDNMGIIKLDNASTTYNINFTKNGLEYVFSSTLGFLIRGNVQYGQKICI